MEWQITYYSESVYKNIENWPVGIRAFYAKVTERIKVYLGMPFTRPMGQGLFEIRAKGKEGIGRAFSVQLLVIKLLFCTHLLRKPKRHRKES